MFYRFDELVDLKRIKTLMQLFYELTGFPSTLIDLDGNILQTENGDKVGVGWKKMCLDFHRVHPTTRSGCLESDIRLSRSVSSCGGAACYTCLNGLVDAASPVVIEGHHVINLFTGQFFTVPPDRDFFRRRAREFGFDEDTYLQSLDEIAVFAPEFVEKGLAFLDMLAAILAELGLKQKKLLEVNQEIEGRVRERTAELVAANAELERREVELAKLNDRLSELDRAKTDFFSNVSHEFRTPLTLILGPVERLLDSASLAEDQARALATIRRNARTLLKHVNDLLDIARLDAGRMVLSYCNADLAGTVRMVCSHFETLASDRGIHFAVETPDRLAAQMDVDKVERIVVNLLSNAFNFAPEGGRVVCTVFAVEDGMATISVRDSGPGIPPDMRALVFDRFRQSDADPARRLGGSGLGLAIAKDFATLHRATVTVGDAPEGGALFDVMLPLRAPEGAVVEARPSCGGMSTLDPLEDTVADDPPAEEEGANPDGRPLALVVEDNAELRRFIVETLCDDFRVATAADGNEGFHRVLSLHPDLIVTDIMMPTLSGERMVAALRAEGIDDPHILVLSAKADDALRLKLLQGGAQDYLIKPFLAEELRARAVNLATLKQARDILRRQLSSRDCDLAVLAAEIAGQNSRLERSAWEAQAARDRAEADSLAKSRFLAMVSHELRSPLQNFALYLSLLRETCGGDARIAKLLDRLDTASGRMGQIVSTVLQHGAIESGRFQVTVAPVAMAAVVAEVVAELSDRAHAKGLALMHATPPAALPPLATDANLLRLILHNLVDNAIKYSHKGTVTISLGYEQGMHRCTVSDTGIGIAVEDQLRIFEPFEQVETIDHKHTHGVGLGLTLVKGIAGVLGGRVDLASAPAHGSAFTLCLPSLPEP